MLVSDTSENVVRLCNVQAYRFLNVDEMCVRFTFHYKKGDICIFVVSTLYKVDLARKGEPWMYGCTTKQVLNHKVILSFIHSNRKL